MAPTPGNDAAEEVELELLGANIVNEEEATPRRRRKDEKEDAWKLPLETFTSHLRDDDSLRGLKRKQREFYRNQNEFINSLVEVDERTRDGRVVTEEEEEAEQKKKDKHALSKNIAIYGSTACNVFLLVLKIVAAVLSGSLSVMASAFDSFLDLVSGAVIVLTDYLAKKTPEGNYPAGKTRFEPVGVLIFSAAMFTATFQLLLSSVETLITKDLDLQIDLVTYIVLGTTIVLKFFLWIYCRTVGDSETVKTLATDHRNDVFSNIFGCVAAVLGYHFRWWIDPCGAIGISLLLMSVWAGNGYEQLAALTGKTAPPELLKALTYIARNHHPDIVAIDTVRAYHHGYNFMCELDIVLAPDMPLQTAHDIGESLQNKLESIEFIERAFVHLDFEWEHKPEHNKNN